MIIATTGAVGSVICGVLIICKTEKSIAEKISKEEPYCCDILWLYDVLEYNIHTENISKSWCYESTKLNGIVSGLLLVAVILDIITSCVK